MVKCSEIMRKQKFDSYSEFYLALCLAAECARRDKTLDMTDMRVEADTLPKSQLEYYKYLLFIGAIYVEGYGEVDDPAIKPGLYFDTSLITKQIGTLWKEEKDIYHWSPEIASEICPDDLRSEMLNRSKKGNILMHLIAYYLMGRYFRDLDTKKLVIEITNHHDVRTTYLYENIISCEKFLVWFNEYVDLRIDYGELNVDIDFSVFFNDGMAAKRFHKWSIKDKQKFLKNAGMEVGSILVLWNRKGVCDTNKSGRIDGAYIIRLDEIGENFIAINKMGLNKTKEEVILDYYSTPEESRHLFTDLLDYKPFQNNQILELYNVGIENYMFDEDSFITKLDMTAEDVIKRVTIDGEEKEVPMNNPNAIYWLLCQYSIDFDRELFRKMYSNGEDLLWDIYGVEEE